MTDLKRDLLSGVAYTALAKYAGIVVMLVVTGVLARLLTPSEFGVVAISTMIITFFSIFSDLGIAPAVVQHKELTERDLSNIFSLTAWSGAVMAVLFFAAAPLIADFYDHSAILRSVCRVLAVNLFFASVNIVPNALIVRDKRFRFIAFRSLVVQLVGGTAAVAAALAGAGIYALTVNPIFAGAMLFVINYRQHPLPLRLRVEGASLRKVFSFSAFQFSFQVLNFFGRHLDKLLMGRYMSMAQLGYYEKSYRLMMLPLENISYVLGPVMHPVFSEFRHDLPHLAASYLKVLRPLAFIGFPLSAVLYFTAPELVLIVFGPQWTPSIPVFRILALSVGLQILMSTSGPIFQAADSTRMMFWCGVFSSTITVSAILTGIFAFGTMEAVAACVCTAFALSFLQCFYTLFCRTFRMSWKPFWRQLGSPFALAVALCVPLGALHLWLPPVPHVASLAVKGATALIIWALWIQVSGAFDLKGFAAAKIFRRP